MIWNYMIIYSFLSDYTHPSIPGLGLVTEEHGALNALSNELKSEAMFFGISFCAMILDEMRRLPTVSESGKSDIAVVTKRIKTKAALLLDETFRGKRSSPFEILAKRLKSMGI